MQRFKSLLVALSRTGSDDGLIRYAAAVAETSKATALRFVHVLTRPRNAAAVANHDEVVAEARSRVTAQAPRLAERADLSFSILTGAPTDQLLAEAAETHADLLLLGHRQGGQAHRPLARRLAMAAPCSVWMVPDGREPLFRRLLVPVDFSEPSADALRVAIGLAAATGQTEVAALHVYFNAASLSPEELVEYDADLRGQEREAFRRFVAPIDLRGVKLTPLFVESSQVGDTISRVASEQGADAVIMATRGRSLSSAILLGSVTEAAMLQTPRPFLAVKHFGAKLGVLEALLDKRFREKGKIRTD